MVLNSAPGNLSGVMISIHRFLFRFLQIPIKASVQKLSILFIALLAVAGCRENKQLRNTILEVKKTGMLVTAEYTLGKIVKASDDKTWYKVGNRKILMSLEAELKAGIDLQDISEKNFRESEHTLFVTLPHARIFSLSIPPEKIKLEYQEVDLLRDPFSAAEREKLLAQAEQQIRKLADSLKILNTAEENAALYFENLMQQSGYKNVQVSFSGNKKQ